MKSEELYNHLTSLWKEYHEELKDYHNKNKSKLEAINPYPSIGGYSTVYNKYVSDISDLFIDLIETSLNENYYWEFCEFKVYESCYNSRFNEFQEHYPSANEEEFIIHELNVLEGRNLGDFVWIHEDQYLDVPKRLFSITEFIGFDYHTRILYSERRKIEFLEKKSGSSEGLLEIDITYFKDEKYKAAFDHLINTETVNDNIAYVYRRFREDDKSDPKINLNKGDFENIMKQILHRAFRTKTLLDLQNSDRDNEFRSLLKKFEIKYQGID